MACNISVGRGRKFLDSLRRNTAIMAAVAAGCAGYLALPAPAATQIQWSPTAANSTWATGSNWVGGSAPTSDLVTNIAYFDSTSYTSQPNAGTTSINGIVIGDGSTATAALALSGTMLTIGGGGITMFANAGAATISSPLTLGAPETWTNNAASLLTITGNITNGANLLTIAGTGNTSISGVLGSGSGGLTTFGTGSLTLTGANTYTGTTSVNSGTMFLDFSATGAPATGGIINNGATSVGTASSALVLGGGTLSVKGNGGATPTQYFASTTINPGQSAIIVNANGGTAAVALGAITRNTGGTVVFTLPTGTPSATNGITISTGVTNSILGTGWAIVSSSGTAANNSANGYTFATLSGTNIVAYTGATAETGTGTWGGLSGKNYAANYDLSGAGTFSGAGSARGANTIRYTGIGASQSGSTITINCFLNSGTGTFTVGSGVIIGATTDTELVLAAAPAPLVISGVIADGSSASAVTIMGPSTTTLSGVNTYTGQTYINNAVVNIIADSGLGAAGTGATLNMNGGTLQAGAATVGLYNGSAGTNNRNVVLGASGGTFDSQANTLIIAGTISSATPNYGNLTKIGSGTLTLSGANTYSGQTLINNGTLALTGTGSINSSPRISIASGATFNVSGVTGGYAMAAGQTLAAFGTGTANVTGSVNVGGQTINMQDGTNIGTLALSSGLTLNGATLDFDLGSSSNDMLTIAGAAALSNISTINIGALTSANSLAVGTTAYTLITAASGLNNGNFTLANTKIIVGSVPYTLSLSGDATHEYLGVSTAPTVTWTGATSYNWTSATDNWAPGAYSDGSPVVFDSTGANGSNIVIPSGGVLPLNVTFSNTSGHPYTFDSTGGPIAGALDAVVVSGGGSVTFNNANTYGGGLGISAGSTVTAGNASALGIGTVTLSGSATLDLAMDRSTNFGNAVQISGPATILSDRATAHSAGVSTDAGNTGDRRSDAHGRAWQQCKQR